MLFFVFFFNDTATTEIYTLSLHDALPISRCRPGAARGDRRAGRSLARRSRSPAGRRSTRWSAGSATSRTHADRKSTRLNSSHTVISYAVFCLKTEEHTSERQSHSDIVCLLLLEKRRGHGWTPVSQLARMHRSA